MTLFPPSTLGRAERLLARAREQRMTICTAESCTGGLLSGCLTEIPGSSDVIDRAFVTYSNAAKAQVLGVPAPLIEQHGAVSEAVVRAMAEGALRASGCSLAIAVTGIAGPGGGSADKPVGLVHFAVALANTTHHAERRFGEVGRTYVRLSSVKFALDMALDAIG